MSHDARLIVSVVGAVILGATGHEDFTAAWVCLVLGVHFVPLDRVFPGIGLTWLAAAVVCVAVAAFIVGVTTSTPPSAVTGLGTGACLLGHAAALLVIAGRRASRDPDLGPYHPRA